MRRAELYGGLPFAFVLLVLSCKGGTNSTSGGPSEFIVACENAAAGVVAATDETYTKFVEAESARRLLSDPCKSPELTSPSESDGLRSGQPPTFSFRPAHSVCLLKSTTNAGRLACNARRGKVGFFGVARFLGDLLIPSAHAHCPAVSGENYYLKIVTDQSTVIYSAILSVTSFTPDAAIWASAFRGQTNRRVNLTIERGIFLRGDLIEGPYVQPRAYSFQINP